MHRLGGADRQPGGAFAENGLQGADLDRIALRRGGAVGVDIVDVGGRQAGIGQGQLEGGTPGPRRLRADEVAVVATGAVAEHFAVDAGATGDGMVPVFEHQCRPALAEHQSAVGRRRRGGRRRASCRHRRAP